MLFTTKMKQLVAVVLDKDVEKITRELLSQSLLHFVSIKEFSSDWKNKVDNVESRVSQAMLGEIRNRIESFLSIIQIHPGESTTLDIHKLKAVDINETKKMLDKIAEKLQAIREHQRVLQQDILKYEDIKRQLDLFGDIGAGIQSKSKYSFLNIQTGAVKNTLISNFEQALTELPSVSLNFQTDNNLTHMLLITMKKDDSRINAILDKFGWVDIDLAENMGGLQENVNKDIGKKLEQLVTKQAALKTESDDMINQNRENLLNLWENIRMNELYYKIQSYFSKTSRTVIFSGWLPAENQQPLEQALRQVTGGRCYLEWNDPAELQEKQHKKIKVPVKFKNPRFLSPFQMLVQNFSIPEYGTVDPTPFVAVAYLMMFGLMFGDVGQGLVLILTGLIGQLIYRGKSGGIRNLLRLIAWCGGAAVVAGILFGSYFGFAWFKPLWFDYHAIIAGDEPKIGPVKNINGILVITVYFGIFIIAVGLVLNWINLVARRQWFKLIFDKGGVLGVWIYAVGVYFASLFVRNNFAVDPASASLVWLLGVPIVLFMLKPPLEFIIHKKHDPAVKFTPLTPVDFLMEWVVEMLEVFSGYLANTLSFMRVAGLGIAHTSLMIAFYEIARMINGGNAGNFGFWSFFVLVLGNIFVILLEGLSAGIQSLRLNYYEFFSKYFSGSGKAYAPVSLRSYK